MNRFLLIFFSFFYFYTNALEVCSFSQEEHYLTHRIHDQDKRRPTFLLALKLLNQLKAKVLIETGTARYGDRNFWGDGGSTIIFGNWASENNAALYSVDSSATAIENAKQATQPYEGRIHFYVSDSIQFLKNFDQSIDFLYLDSYDFDINNPLPSQTHHLKEIIAAYPLLHEKSIVMIDDCDLAYGGKGQLVIEFLISKGWKILYKGYQVILVRENAFDFIQALL